MFAQKLSVDFFHIFHRSHSRTATQRIPKRLYLVCAADRVNFDAPIEQIPCVSVHTEIRRCPLDKEAEADPLHSSGDKKPFGQSFHDNTLRA
jgi:hypothetical protein